MAPWGLGVQWPLNTSCTVFVSRCAELEALFENTRHELCVTQEALAKFQTSQMESTQMGIEHEESLLNESAARESSLNTQVVNMEIDLKNTKQENQRLRAEKAQIEQVITHCQTEKS